MGSGSHLSLKGTERCERVGSVSETRDFMDTRLFLDSNFIRCGLVLARGQKCATGFAAFSGRAAMCGASLYLLLSLTQHVPLNPLVDVFMIGRALCRLTGLWENRGQILQQAACERLSSLTLLTD